MRAITNFITALVVLLFMTLGFYAALLVTP